MIDLYAGSLTKYCAGQWETSGVSIMRAAGINITTVYGVPPPAELGQVMDSGPHRDVMGKAPWIAAESAAVKVAEWIALLNAQVFQASVAPNEALEEYWTEQFPARVRDALIVWVAHLQRPDLPRPEKLTAPPATYAAYREAIEKGSYVGPIAVVEATIFLPSSVNKLCGHNDALGRPALVTTTWALRTILDQINERCWQAGKTQQEAWLRASDGATLESAAQDGWARLSKACDFANENGVAVVVDQ